MLVRGLPIDATEREVRQHFSDLFQLSAPDWEAPGWFYCLGRKAPRLVRHDLHGASRTGPPKGVEFGLDHARPVSDVANTQDGRYFGSWVAEVTLVYKDGDALRRFVKRKEVRLRCDVQGSMKTGAPTH